MIGRITPAQEPPGVCKERKAPPCGACDVIPCQADAWSRWPPGRRRSGELPRSGSGEVPTGNMEYFLVEIHGFTEAEEIGAVQEVIEWAGGRSSRRQSDDRFSPVSMQDASGPGETVRLNGSMFSAFRAKYARRNACLWSCSISMASIGTMSSSVQPRQCNETVADVILSTTHGDLKPYPRSQSIHQPFLQVIFVPGSTYSMSQAGQRQ